MSDEPIPKTLEETAEALDKMLDEESRQLIRAAKTTEDVHHILIGAHHGLGRHLRNTWGLWTDSDLAKDMRKRGIDHPDDMSHAIMAHYAQWCVRSRYQRIRDDNARSE